MLAHVGRFQKAKMKSQLGKERKGEKGRATAPPPHPHIPLLPSPQHLEGSGVTAGRSTRSDTGVLFQKSGRHQKQPVPRIPADQKARVKLTKFLPASDSPSRLPKQSAVLQEPFGYNQSPGLSRSPSPL